MPLKLIAPIYKTFTLTRSDELYGNKDDPTTITVKQASQREHAQRQDVFSSLERRYDERIPEEVRLVQNVSIENLKRLQAWLTLVECGITDIADAPLFPSAKDKNSNSELKMNQTQFNLAWGLLPPEIVEEISEKILEVNPIWSGRTGEQK